MTDEQIPGWAWRRAATDFLQIGKEYVAISPDGEGAYVSINNEEFPEADCELHITREEALAAMQRAEPEITDAMVSAGVKALKQMIDYNGEDAIVKTVLEAALSARREHHE